MIPLRTGARSHCFSTQRPRTLGSTNVSDSHRTWSWWTYDMNETPYFRGDAEESLDVLMFEP